MRRAVLRSVRFGNVEGGIFEEPVLVAGLGPERDHWQARLSHRPESLAGVFICNRARLDLLRFVSQLPAQYLADIVLRQFCSELH